MTESYTKVNGFCRPDALLRPPARLLQRLEADLEAVAGRLGEAAERARRGQAAPAFQPRDRALRRLHAFGELGLTEPRALACLGDFEDERELLLQRVVFAAEFRVVHPL